MHARTGRCEAGKLAKPGATHEAGRVRESVLVRPCLRDKIPPRAKSEQGTRTAGLGCIGPRHVRCVADATPRPYDVLLPPAFSSRYRHGGHPSPHLPADPPVPRRAAGQGACERPWWCHASWSNG